jgi:hypothetical protein
VALVSRIPPAIAGSLPELAGGCSVPRFEEGRRFFSDPAHSPPGASATLLKVGDTVSACKALRERVGRAPYLVAPGS